MNQRHRMAIGLGSNLGDRLQMLRSAALRISQDLLERTVGSHIYETAPWGIVEQPSFLNAVMMGETEWKPPAVLNFLKTLEKELGRVPNVRYGPRSINLDILAWSAGEWNVDGLEVPHPGLTAREFVLRPLCDVWPEWEHPELHRRASRLLTDWLQTQPSTATKIEALLLDKANR